MAGRRVYRDAARSVGSGREEAAGRGAWRFRRLRSFGDRFEWAHRRGRAGFGPAAHAGIF
jgi:hypothetical protein